MMSSINFSFALDEKEVMNKGLGNLLYDLKMASDGRLGFRVEYSDVEYVGMWERVVDD